MQQPQMLCNITILFAGKVLSYLALGLSPFSFCNRLWHNEIFWHSVVAHLRGDHCDDSLAAAWGSAPLYQTADRGEQNHNLWGEIHRGNRTGKFIFSGVLQQFYSWLKRLAGNWQPHFLQHDFPK
jgi:hypothetical protein